MTIQGKGFAGGDNLMGFEKKVHEVIMKTELNNGKDTYRLSYADGKSDLSFGSNRMDLSSGKEEYNELFLEILQNANDINN